jgi:hypothetical protein
VVEERDFAADAPELLHEQDLVGVLSGEPIGAEHRHDIDGGVPDGIPEGVQRGAVQAGAAVALIAEHVGLSQRMARGDGPVPQGRDLAADGLLTLLALGRHSSIDGGAHLSFPGSGCAGRVGPASSATARR